MICLICKSKKFFACGKPLFLKNFRFCLTNSNPVSVARNVHQQKHLLLCNLKELYQPYKEKFSQQKIGLSQFYELWPKWCITISSSGTHSVCVYCPPKHKINCLSFLQCHQQEHQETWKGFLQKQKQTIKNKNINTRWNRTKLLIV